MIPATDRVNSINANRGCDTGANETGQNLTLRSADKDDRDDLGEGSSARGN